LSALELGLVAAGVLLAAILAVLGYALCVAAGRADDATRRELERRGLFDGAAPGARRGMPAALPAWVGNATRGQPGRTPQRIPLAVVVPGRRRRRARARPA
jgi:hypothetical protein